MLDLFTAALDWFNSHPYLAVKVVLASVLLAVVSLAVLVVAIIKMSPDYFVADKPPDSSWRWRHPLLRIVFKALKSIAGLVLLLAGIVLLLTPGQGLLTMLVGLSLIEFPGKRRLEQRMLRERHVLKSITWLRARAGRAPMIVPPKRGDS